VKIVSPKADLHFPRSPAVFHRASLDVSAPVLEAVTGWITRHRRRPGAGPAQRAGTVHTQVTLALRWLRHRLDLRTLAIEGGLSIATAYRYLHEGIDVLAAQAPDLHQVLEAGKAADWTHVTLDGTLIATDRCRTVNPESGHDLWYSGKDRAHGGNVQIVGDPTGFPVGSLTSSRARPTTSPSPASPASLARCGVPAGPAQPGRRGLRRRRCGHPHAGQGRRAASRHRRRQRADRLPTRPGRARHRAAQTRWKALRRIRLCPQRIGAVVAAALVLTTLE
jgi:hypothetical protein